MGRLIQEQIKQPLAEELLFGKLADGGEVPVSVKDGKPSFELTPAPPKAKRKAPAQKEGGGKEEPDAGADREAGNKGEG